MKAMAVRNAAAETLLLLSLGTSFPGVAMMVMGGEEGAVGVPVALVFREDGS